MARIVFTLEDGTEIETELDSDVITIGRHEDSIVVLPSGSVSSHHATIKRRGESFYVQDLGTTNGTRLNGVEVEEAKLEDGDQLTFGDIPAIVHLTEALKVVPTVVPLPSVSSPPSAPARPPRGPSRAPRPARSYSRPVQYKESTGCASFLTFLFFLVLAFLIGLHVRHGVVTGGFLLQDVMVKLREKADGVEKAAEPTEPAPESTPGSAPAPASGQTPGPTGAAKAPAME